MADFAAGFTQQTGPAKVPDPFGGPGPVPGTNSGLFEAEFSDFAAAPPQAPVEPMVPLQASDKVRSCVRSILYRMRVNACP